MRFRASITASMIAGTLGAALNCDSSRETEQWIKRQVLTHVDGELPEQVRMGSIDIHAGRGKQEICGSTTFPLDEISVGGYFDVAGTTFIASKGADFLYSANCDRLIPPAKCVCEASSSGCSKLNDRILNSDPILTAYWYGRILGSDRVRGTLCVSDPVSINLYSGVHEGSWT